MACGVKGHWRHQYSPQVSLAAKRTCTQIEPRAIDACNTRTNAHAGTRRVTGIRRRSSRRRPRAILTKQVLIPLKIVSSTQVETNTPQRPVCSSSVNRLDLIIHHAEIQRGATDRTDRTAGKRQSYVFRTALRSNISATPNHAIQVRYCIAHLNRASSASTPWPTM